MTTILSKHPTYIHHVYVHENACTQEDQFIFELLLYTLAETTQGRIDSPRKLAETTHLPRPKRPTPKIGRNDPGRNDSGRNDPGPKRPGFLDFAYCVLRYLVRDDSFHDKFYTTLSNAESPIFNAISLTAEMLDLFKEIEIFFTLA